VDGRVEPGHDGKGENVDARDIGAKRDALTSPARGGGRRARRARRAGETLFKLAPV